MIDQFALNLIHSLVNELSHIFRVAWIFGIYRIGLVVTLSLCVALLRVGLPIQRLQLVRR
jgi:hypothetical protein